MQEIVYICSYYAGKRAGRTNENKKYSKGMLMAVGTVKGNPIYYLEYANSLYKNLQLTLETSNDK